MATSYMVTSKRMTAVERELKECKAHMEEWKKEKNLFLKWKKRENIAREQERKEFRAEIHALKGDISALRKELAETKERGCLEDGEIQPSMIDELNTIRAQVQEIREEGEKKTSWVEVLSKTQKKVEEAEKWIEVAKKGKGKDFPATPDIINKTLEEEQRRRVRALHVRVTGLKDLNKVDQEVKSLMSMMGVEKPSHTQAWRVGKKNEGNVGSSKERALILRFPSIEEKKDFLKKRPTLKKTGIFLGDDLTLSQLAHMREVMPEIRAAREKGKVAFYRDGRVVITERRST